jgi:hypothetical protein
MIWPDKTWFFVPYQVISQINSILHLSHIIILCVWNRIIYLNSWFQVFFEKFLVFMFIILYLSFMLFFNCWLFLRKFFKVFYTLKTSFWFKSLIHFIMIFWFVLEIILLIFISICHSLLDLLICRLLILYLCGNLLGCHSLIYVFRFVHILKRNLWICWKCGLICWFSYLFF